MIVRLVADIQNRLFWRPFGPYNGEIPPSRTEPPPPEPASQDVVPIPSSEVKTFLSALFIAADYKRDRTEMCADCTGQTCLTCESRLWDAQAYDCLSAQLIQAAEASAAATVSPPQPAPAADREAGHRDRHRDPEPDLEAEPMTLTIHDTTMTGDQTPHIAWHAPSRNGWEVSWLPGKILDRNTAITAMILADITAETDLHEGHRLWPQPPARPSRRPARPGGRGLTSQTYAQDR
jgi:hypothetical protein